jgi:hypothetical protein
MKKVIAIIAMGILSLKSYSQNTNVYVYDMGKYVPVKRSKAEIKRINAEADKRDKEGTAKIADERELNSLIDNLTMDLITAEAIYTYVLSENSTQEKILETKKELDSILAKRQLYLDEWNRKGYNVSGRKRIK